MDFNDLTTTVKIVFSSKKYKALGIGSFFIFLLFYLFTLPAVYTGGKIGIISLQFLTPLLGMFALLIALLLGFIIPFTAYSFKQKVELQKGSTVGGFIGSITPPLLCCSPLIPNIVAILGALSPTLLGMGGWIQGFIATNEVYILSGSTLLLIFAFLQNVESLRRCLVKNKPLNSNHLMEEHINNSSAKRCEDE